jgi:glycine oxidase
MTRVAIVGGGVCGLGVGWQLARRGAEVVLFERDAEPARAATWAAAGMLAPHMELRPEEERITLLGRESLRRWRRFAAEVEADAGGGLSVDYRDEGTLFVALDRDAGEQLRFLHRHQRELELPVEWLSGDEAREREPYLSRRVSAALFSGVDHQVEPRALGRALARAFSHAGGALHTQAPVERILVRGGRVAGVSVHGQAVEADHVLLAAGAWSGLIDGLPPGLEPPVRPVKGQMLALEQPDPPLLRHCVWAMDATQTVYLAPKSDGRLLVGATVEEMGFDLRVTAGAVLDLRRLAWETVPGVYELPLVESWAGLRPASRDNAPILGASPIEGLYLATGHYRNGILFAPVTAEDVAQLILTGETSPTIEPFGPHRYLAPQAACTSLRSGPLGEPALEAPAYGD